MQRWAGRPVWLRSAEASVERWSPPFSVVYWLSNQSVGSPVPRQKKRAATVSSAAISSSPCGTGTGGDRGGGVFGLLRLGAGGVIGWCGDLSRPGECRVGLCRHGFLLGRSDCVGGARFRCVGTGVHTLWCPLWQQWRTPLCLGVHLGQGGKLCSGHSCSWGP